MRMGHMVKSTFSKAIATYTTRTRPYIPKRAHVHLMPRRIQSPELRTRAEIVQATLDVLYKVLWEDTVLHSIKQAVACMLWK